MNITESQIDMAYKQALDSLTSDELGSDEQTELKVAFPKIATCIIERVSKKLNISERDVIVSSVMNYAEFRYYLFMKEKNTKEFIKKEG